MDPLPLGDLSLDFDLELMTFLTSNWIFLLPIYDSLTLFKVVVNGVTPMLFKLSVWAPFFKLTAVLCLSPISLDVLQELYS